MVRGMPFPEKKRKAKKKHEEEKPKNPLPPGFDIDSLSEHEKQMFFESYNIDAGDKRDDSSSSTDTSGTDNPDGGAKKESPAPMMASSPISEAPEISSDLAEEASKPIVEPVATIPEPVSKNLAGFTEKAVDNIPKIVPEPVEPITECKNGSASEDSESESEPVPDAEHKESPVKSDRKDKIIKKLKEEKSELADSNEKYKRDLKKLNEDYSELSSKLNKANQDLSSKQTEVETLSQTIKRMEESARTDGGAIKTLTNQKKIAEDDRDKFRNELEKANAEIERLNKEIENAKTSGGTPSPDSDNMQLIGSVVRSTADTLYSALFTEERYTVRLARDGRTLSFIPDIAGRATCSGNTIRIPRLSVYLKFSAPLTYPLYRDGLSMVAKLDSSVRS